MQDERRRSRLERALNNRKRWLAPFLCFLFAGGVGWVLSAQPAPAEFVATTKNGEWQNYTGDARGWRYSPLDQITAQNFNDLEVAWRFKTDNLGTRPEYKLEGTPLMIGGILYATGGTRRAVFALD